MSSAAFVHQALCSRFFFPLKARSGTEESPLLRLLFGQYDE